MSTRAGQNWKRRLTALARWTWALAVLVACALGAPAIPVAQAQPPEPWTEPKQLSSGLLDEAGQPLSLCYPTMVADPWGNVHAFWTRLRREEDVSFDGLLFYSRWDGSAWSLPTDVVFLARTVIWRPQAAIEPSGRIDLVWTAGYGGPAWYASVPAPEAGSARAWSEPRQLFDSGVSGVGIATDKAGRSHVVFCGAEEDDSCYYTSSTDGVDWLEPSLIHTGCHDCDARVAADERGRIHVIFGSQATDGTVMYYARSDDGGKTWPTALELDRAGETYSEHYGPAWGTVVTLGLDEVHVIWFGAPSGQRWHRWSRNGGDTWSEAEQISADHRGLTLPVAAAFDSDGTLHVVSMGWRESGGLRSGPFHLTWKDGRWSEPALMGSRSDWDAEYAAAAIARGNRLVASWTDKNGPKQTFQIWASTLRVDAPGLELATPVPTAIPSVLPPAETQELQPSQDVVGAERTTEPSSQSTPLSAEGLDARPAQPEWLTYLLGILPPLILLGLVLAIRAARQRRGG